MKYSNIAGNLSEREGHDVGLTFAAQSYVADVMPFRSDSGSDMGART